MNIVCLEFYTSLTGDYKTGYLTGCSSLVILLFIKHCLAVEIYAESRSTFTT